MTNKFFAAAMVAFTLSLGQASAATVIYDESVNGDIDAIGSTNVNLVAGVNEILGSINQTPPAESDYIHFTQVAGLVVDSIVLSFSGPFGRGENLNSALFNNVANLFDSNFNAINSGASISASFFDSFGPDTGPLSQTTFGAIWDFQLAAGVVFAGKPWKLTITTSQVQVPSVPLPAPFLLLLSALGGLAVIRRRKETLRAAIQA